jgi:DNA-binding FrmR family transcriptional regulator
MLDDTRRQEIVRRLDRAEAQVRDLRRMIRESTNCPELLKHFAASESALNAIGIRILRYHLEHCVPEGVSRGGSEQQNRLNELVDIFDRFAK